MSTRSTNASSTSARAVKTTTEAAVSEADFDDKIAKNRALPMPDPASIISPPKGYRPTEIETRRKRLRRLPEEQRAEGVVALNESSSRNLKEELGPTAPDPARAAVLAERLARSGELRARAARLYQYAKENDEIVRSDALIYLEAVNKQFAHLAGDLPELEERYPALKRLFEMRTDAIVEGMARAKAAKAGEAAKTDEEPEAEEPAVEEEVQ